MPTTPEMDPSQPDAPPRETWGWTRRQRVALGTLTGLLILILAMQFWRRPARLDEPTNTSLPALPQKMNPNAASVAELARIPHIGEALAGRIIDYRAARQGAALDGIVFRNLEDLDKVPGVGKKLLEQLEPYLDFPDITPDDKSSTNEHQETQMDRP
jgi:hypothetical protein